MADKIHGKKKDWPHFDTIHLGSDAYAEGYDRIFGKKDKDGKKKHETRRGRALQKASRKVAAQRGKKPKSARRIHRSEKVRED